jgi:hypothetical protein
MASLNLGANQPYLILFIGIIAMVIPLFYKSKTENLEKTGERCEGIIFKLDYSNSFSSDGSSSVVKDKITVRFGNPSEFTIETKLGTAKANALAPNGLRTPGLEIHKKNLPF